MTYFIFKIRQKEYCVLIENLTKRATMLVRRQYVRDQNEIGLRHRQQ